MNNHGCFTRMNCKRILTVVLALALGSACAFAEGTFEEVINRQNYLYGQDFTAWLAHDKEHSWNDAYDTKIPAEFSGELGYVTADLDMDGEKELLTVGTYDVDEWDNDYEDYWHWKKLRVRVFEPGEAEAHDCMQLSMSATDGNLAASDDPTEQPVNEILRVYLYGKEPYVMLENYSVESLRGDGSEYNYTILKYDGNALQLIAEDGYAGSDYPGFDPESANDLAQTGISCMDFNAVDNGDGIIQNVEDYTPIAGLIVRTIVSYDEFEKWEEARNRGALDVSVMHVFSREELEKGILKKLWKGDNVDMVSLIDSRATLNGCVEAVGDTNIRSLPSLDGKVIGLLKKGDTADYLNITMEDDRGVNWYCVSVGNTYGWVSEKYTIGRFDESICTIVGK